MGLLLVFLAWWCHFLHEPFFLKEWNNEHGCLRTLIVASMHMPVNLVLHSLVIMASWNVKHVHACIFWKWSSVATMPVQGQTFQSHTPFHMFFYWSLFVRFSQCRRFLFSSVQPSSTVVSETSHSFGMLSAKSLQTKLFLQSKLKTNWLQCLERTLHL
jgi:hypothetical protein